MRSARTWGTPRPGPSPARDRLRGGPDAPGLIGCNAAEDRDRAVAPRGEHRVGWLTNKVKRAGEPVALDAECIAGLHHLARRRTTRQGIEPSPSSHLRLHQTGSVNPLIPVVARPL